MVGDEQAELSRDVDLVICGSVTHGAETLEDQTADMVGVCCGLPCVHVEAFLSDRPVGLVIFHG